MSAIQHRPKYNGNNDDDGAVTSVAQLVGHHPTKLLQFLVRAHARVVGSIPGWGMYKRQLMFLTLMFVSLLLSHPSPLSMSKEVKSFTK